MTENDINNNGLSASQVLEARQKHGDNRLQYKKENGFIEAVLGLLKDPMLILLLVAALIYFISGDMANGIFLGGAIVLQVMMSLYQDSRSRNALENLKNITRPKCRVIREGIEAEINIEDLVMGDHLVAEEGSSISADGIIIQSNDFSVNESVLTGESMPVFKDVSKEDKAVFRGTTVASGLAVAVVTAVGNETRLGKIGKSLENIKEEKTPLEKQIVNFVKKMAIAGALVFVIVWAINYFHSYQLLDSLLKALTLAMSILPEEIPVAFTTFMALGAWRLMKTGIVVKQMKTVETLGSATVICTDKTGTITENNMQLAKLFLLSTNQVSDADGPLNDDEKDLVRFGMWASEPIPFDPMETALHRAYAGFIQPDERPLYKIIHEYPLGGKPPMMTHIFEAAGGNRIVAAKGAPEALITVSKLNESDRQAVEHAVQTLAADGYRVLGVGSASIAGNAFPAIQQDIPFAFKGLLAFYDPPKKNIRPVLESFYAAGIAVKIVTGDNAATTAAIAKQAGFRGYEKTISGNELMQLSDEDLKKAVEDKQVFTRMFPEAKLKIINALKANNEIVAMTGDGVNDGPALKAAHIGIAMGKKGTEIAKQAASLILLEDDLSKMVEAVAMGRKIYTNLKKGIQYIISIHIPIILTVFVPLALGWVYPNIFSPAHIIFLELIMGPTCSIIYENEPMEANAMTLPPRPFTNTFFSWKELTTSIVQGLAITLGTLFTYQYAVYKGFDEAHTRTMVFTMLVTANILLTLVNRSFYYSVADTFKYKNNMVPMVIAITILLLAAMLYWPLLTNFFGFEKPAVADLAVCIATGFIAVAWFELVKWRKRTM